MSFEIPPLPSYIGLHLMAIVLLSAVKIFPCTSGGSAERRRCRIKPLFALVSFVACVPFPTLAQNWPQFRGPEGSGIATETIAVEWGVDHNLAWKAELPGVGWSQPIVWGDKVFVTTAIADAMKVPRRGDWGPGGSMGGLSLLFPGSGKPPDANYQWKVICLDRSTGHVLWEQIAHEGKPPIPVHPNNTYATESPATDGKQLIVSFGMAGIYCYDLAGTLLWSKELGTFPMQFDWGTGSSPIIYRDQVFVQCDNDKASFLVALDAKTGEERWRVDRDERSNWSTPFIWKNTQRTELIAAGGTKMRSYEPTTGKLLWEMTGCGRTAISPVGNEELLFVDSYDWMTGKRGQLVAIHPGATGEIEFEAGEITHEAVAWSVTLSGTRVASPLLIDDCLYSLEQISGIVRCFDATTGKQHYQERLPGAAGFTASPCAIEGRVFCIDQDGQTFVLQTGPEFNLLARNTLEDEMFWSSPAIASGSLFIRGTDHIFCIRSKEPDAHNEK